MSGKDSVWTAFHIDWVPVTAITEIWKKKT
jgi:hypothetical protein